MLTDKYPEPFEIMGNIKDDGALGIYCYLYYEPFYEFIRGDQTVIISHLQKRFDKESDYIKSKLKILTELNLI